MTNQSEEKTKAVPGAAFPQHFPNSTVKVCQLTGDFDAHLGKPTLSRTLERFGVPGTDLGNPVEHKGRLYFLFGDTGVLGRRWMRDPIAYTTSTDPERIKLEFLADDDGLFRPITIPAIRHLAFEVPVGGISINDVMYIAFVTGYSKEKIMGRSVLAVSEDDGYTFEYLYELSQDKFLNVAMTEVAPGQIKGLPGSTNQVLIWGAGEYRRSNPYLAAVSSEKIRDKNAIRYFAGADKSRKPRWSPSESDAVPLFDHPHIGEFSVAWCDQLRHWLMLYNSSYVDHRGVVFRSAKLPWGPWSDMEIIFSEFDSGGYGTFMHSPDLQETVGTKLSELKREYIWGHVYGPYMLRRYFRGDARKCTIYFTMSTWNPYQTVIMRADVGYPDQKVPRPPQERDERVPTSGTPTTTDCMLIFGRDNRLLYANQAAMDHMGMTQDRVMNDPSHVPDCWRLWTNRIARVFETGKPIRAEDAIPIVDRLIYLSFTLSPIYDPEGAVSAVSVVYRDITEQREVEQEQQNRQP